MRRDTDAMRLFWDRKARENPMWFIHSTLDFAKPDAAAFWRSGEETLDATLMPFDAAVTRSDRVIEIGCGIGRITRALAQRAATVAAVDVSGEMIRRARAELGHVDNVDWHVGNGCDLREFADGSFTVAYSFIVFQHIPDPAVTCSYVREMGRVLEPGGWAVFQVSEAPAIHRAQRQPWRARVGRLTGRRPRGCDDPAWLGSAVDRGDLLAALASGGLELVASVGDQTQFCLVHARKAASR